MQPGWRDGSILKTIVWVAIGFLLAIVVMWFSRGTPLIININGSVSYAPPSETSTSPQSPMADPTLLTIHQFGSEGVLAEGGVVTDGAATIKGFLLASSNDPLQLQVEMEPIGTAFANAPTGVSQPVPSNQMATVSFSNLGPGWYHWQARVVDTKIQRASSWRVFGSEGNVDVVVGASPIVAGQNRDLRTEVASAAESLVVSKFGNATFAVPGGTYIFGVVMTSDSYAAHAQDPDTYLQLQCSLQPDNATNNALMNGTNIPFTSSLVSTSSVPGGVLVYTKGYNSCPAAYSYLSADIYNARHIQGLACPADDAVFPSAWEGVINQNGSCMGGVADNPDDLIGFLSD